MFILIVNWLIDEKWCDSSEHMVTQSHEFFED